MKPSDYIERGWCQGHYALTNDNVPCSATSDEAKQWCILGACNAAKLTSKELCIFFTLFTQTVGNSIAEWNDAPERTKEEVVTLLRSLNY